MLVFQDLINRDAKLALVGLGYVGLPIAVEFAKHGLSVIGFDINAEKIQTYLNGVDPTNEIGDTAIQNTTVKFTADETELRHAKFIIVAVPTPVNKDHTPNLGPVESACEVVGRNLTPGSIVVFESTVYPGVTEDVCMPILERTSGLQCGTDFKIGYSPERINPGDRVHRLSSIVKIVSGMDAETLDIISKVYELVVKAGVHRAESIQIAEAAKVIENSQRDINIAFMNELSIIFNKMGIDTQAVLRAAGTKWNFINFQPGLVGGHCIGVDPYYLTYKAETLNYHSQIILAGRRINDDMGKYVAEQTVKKLISANVPVKSARVGILGLSFKENCPDTRNTKVVDIVRELQEYGIAPVITDAWAKASMVQREYGIQLQPVDAIRDMDAIILAVAHNEYRLFQVEDIRKFYPVNALRPPVLLDIKGILDRKAYEDAGFLYWRL